MQKSATGAGPFSPHAAKLGWQNRAQPEKETIPLSDTPPPTQDDGREFGRGGVGGGDYRGRQEASIEGKVLLGSVLPTVDSGEGLVNNITLTVALTQTSHK